MGLELAVVTLQGFGVALNLLLHLAFLVLFAGLIVGVHGLALQVVDGRRPRLQSLTKMLPRGATCFLALGLYSLAVAVGLLLLVVPGVLLAVRYAFFGYVLADRQVSALDGLGGAASLSEGRWWALFRFLLVVAALNLMGAALLGFGLLVSFPVTLLATASLFRSLQQGQQSEADSTGAPAEAGLNRGRE